MRLFIALNLNQDTRSRLLALRDALQAQSKQGRYSAPENLHLTLAFLGECSDRQAAAAKAAMDATAFEPLSVAIDCVGRFKRGGKDLWWAGVRRDKPLIDLQGRLSRKLTGAGFSLEKRKYSPHITLGRDVVTDSEPWPIEAFGETVRCMELMKSEQIKGKMVYTPIHEVPRP